MLNVLVAFYYQRKLKNRIAEMAQEEDKAGDVVVEAEVLDDTPNNHRPGLDVALDYYHGNKGTVPVYDSVGEEAARQCMGEEEEEEEEEDYYYDDYDDEYEDMDDDSDDDELSEETKQRLIAQMNDGDRAEYDAADEERKDGLLHYYAEEERLRAKGLVDADGNIPEGRKQLLIAQMGSSTRQQYEASSEDDKRAFLLVANVMAGELDVSPDTPVSKAKSTMTDVLAEVFSRVVEGQVPGELPAPSEPQPPPKKQFPSLVMEDEWKSNTPTLRERAMLTLIDLITDKPSWNTKVNDETIVAKWKAEAQALPTEAVPGGFSDAMFDYAVKELRDKARFFERYNEVVPVMDAAGVVFKQDVLSADTELKAAIQAAIKPLEDVPDKDKDWHPGSDERVLDLVHPSLWPLVYGKSRVLRDRTIGVAEAIDSLGAGDIIPVPDLNLSEKPQWQRNLNAFSTKFQWLPAEVELEGNKAKVTSYINNVHPVEHAPIYTVVERLIEKALPLWDATYDRVMEWQEHKDDLAHVQSNTRIPCMDGGRVCSVPDICTANENGYCNEGNRPGWSELEDGDADYDEDEEWQKNAEWYNESHPPTQPEPAEYKYLGPKEINTSGPWFKGKKNLQVIVKFANIHLTPDKPTYDGGSWHIEGQLNERICATALFYYDNSNITDSHLAFRTITNAEEMHCNFAYEQNDAAPFQKIFGVDPEMGGDSTVIEFGRVLTREGRLLVFPNVYQHRVGSFELADKTKPGHRKIVALFLVDPATPVISTANVPPQQQHWGQDALGGRLPPELAGIIHAEVGCPYGFDEAKRLREELIEERKALEVRVDKAVNLADFCFCEH